MVLCVKWNQNGNWVLTSSKDQIIKVFKLSFPFDSFTWADRDFNLFFLKFSSFWSHYCCTTYFTALWHKIYEGTWIFPWALEGCDRLVAFFLFMYSLVFKLKHLVVENLPNHFYSYCVDLNYWEPGLSYCDAWITCHQVLILLFQET